MQEELLDRCRNASSTQEQSRALEALADFVNQDGTKVSAKEAIGRCVILEFPYSQNAASIDSILDGCGIVVALSSCSKILKELSSSSSFVTKLPTPSVLQACCRTIHRLVIQSDNSAKFSNVDKTVKIDDFVKMILLLPQIISNACHNLQVHQPEWAVAKVFLPHLVENAATDDDDDDDDESSDAYLFSLIKNMLRSLQSDFVAIGLSKAQPCKNLQNLELSPREMASLLSSILKQFVSSNKQDHQALEICFHLLIASSQEHQEAFVQLVVFSKHDSRTCPHIIELLERCDFLYSHLCNIAEIWSQWTFVHQTDSQQQHNVTKVLLCGLSTLSSNDTTMADELTMALLQGVNHRLESFFPPIRIDGMRIAQAVAKRLGQDLQFDELKEEEEKELKDDEDNNDKAVKSVNDLRGESQKIATAEKKKRRRPRKSVQQIDPDAEYDSDEEEKSDSDFTDNDSNQSLGEASVNWDDDLVPYDLNDPEDDLVETPKPLHLIECLDLLRTAENDDHAYSNHETALQCLPDLIQSRPDNLQDIAVSLAYQLLKMENKFNIAGFAEMRKKSIVALIAQEPILVGQHMIDQIFDDSCLSDRLDIFSALQYVAYDLSGNRVIDEKHVKQTKQLQLKSTENSLPSHLESHDMPNHLSRIESKSRRKRSVRNPPKIIKNQFAQVAPVWFYSLLANFVKHKESEALWTGSVGSQLLANFFRTLAVTVEFSASYGSQVLAKDLFDLVWSFRTADVAEVRLSVLISIATSFAMTPGDSFASLFLNSGDTTTLPQIMNEMSARDPDKSCRELALTILQSLREVFNNPVLLN